MMQFEKRSMEEILKYVKETEKNLEDMQQELKKLEDKKNEYLSNLYAGETEVSKKYLEYVNMLRMHLMKQGFPLDESKHLSLQNPDFLECVLKKYGIEVKGGFKVLNDHWVKKVYLSEAEAHLADTFEKYERAIDGLQEKFNINCLVRGSFKRNEKFNRELAQTIKNKNWKYENGKIEPALNEIAQDFFYNVIGDLDIWQNYLNDKFEKDNPGSLEKMVDLKKQIELESDVSNKRSSRFRLRCVFLDLLAKTDFIDSVLKYANNEMEDEDRKALESLCSFKYFNKDNVQNGSVGAFCDELGKNSSFKELANENKEKVLGTLGDFWDGCLKNADEEKDKIVQAKKKFGIKIKVIKPNESKIVDPEEKLANNNFLKLDLNPNGAVQNENEFNNNLVDQNNISPNSNANGNENKIVINANKINSVRNGFLNNINKLNQLQNPDEIANDIDMKLKSDTKSNMASKICFWIFCVSDVLFIIGIIIYPPIGFGLIVTVPAGYYFWRQSNDNKKTGLRVGNDNNVGKPGFGDLNLNGRQNAKAETPGIIINKTQNKGI